MFVHLRLHTEFSIVDSTCRIDEVITAASDDAQSALAITDFNNLFGALKFYNKARGKGIKPILGAEICLENHGRSRDEPSRMLLLIQNSRGYLNLNELLSRAWATNVRKELPIIKLEWLHELNEGLILLSGAQQGEIGKCLLEGDDKQAQETALSFAKLFLNRFYIELQRANRSGDELHLEKAVQLAAQLNLPVVATQPTQFLSLDDFEAHEARVCISEGAVLSDTKRVKRFNAEQYFKSQEKMLTLFADIPTALENTIEIAKRCNLSLSLGKPQLPNFPIPMVDGKQLSTEEYFRHASQQGLLARLEHLYPDEAVRSAKKPLYDERLEFEINTILNMQFPGYFLIVGDFINWAKKNGCPVGPGRGSGAGSLVAYALKITDLDPLQYNLLFERFLNPERVSMPDFDIDFCQSNRNLVIDYVKGKYGKEAVSQIATFGTMAARGVIRDVGRVLDLSYGFCDSISKLIPNKPGTSVTLQLPPPDRKPDDKLIYACVDEPLLAEREAAEDDVKMLLDLARKLEGLTRNVGMHAGGVLIAPGKLTDFCPLYQQPGSESAVSQFDKDDVEAIGLVKFDFLGLATLTILEEAAKLIRARHKGQENFSFDDLPLDDEKVYRLFSQGKTEAIFQFESGGMQKMLRDAKPTRLEDLIALNALYRPGPMDLIPSFVARKHGREEIEYPHPLVADMLSETYGIMVYQEQVMQTAQILGGYSLGGADMLRRAMGKKKPEEMAAHREIFREGSAKNGIEKNKADEIFDLMEKFAGYGFNKSHAAAYSLLAYQTAWLKVHYTAEFFCANMTVEMDNTDKLKTLFADACEFGIRFLPPDVNRSVYKFMPVSNKEINYGLGAIKGTGENAIRAIVAAREGLGSVSDEIGSFTSFFNFVKRVDRTSINKRTVDALIKAGTFDSLHGNRAALLENVDQAFDYASSVQDNANQMGLFDFGGEDNHGSSQQEPALITATPWSIRENLMEEKAALGFYFSGHLFDEVKTEIRQFAKTKISDIDTGSDLVLLAGIVNNVRVLNGFRGKVILFSLDDKSGSLDVRADEGLFKTLSTPLKEDDVLIAQGQVKNDRFTGGLQLNINQVWTIEQARCRFGKFFQLDVGDPQELDFSSFFKTHPPRREQTDQGELLRGISLRLSFTRSCQSPNPTFIKGAQAQLNLGEQYLFFPSDEAIACIRGLVPNSPHDGSIVYSN